MAHAKSGFVQGMGKGFEVLRTLANAICRSRFRNAKHDPDEALSTLLTDPPLADFLAGIIIRRKHHIQLMKTVKVDYSLDALYRAKNKMALEHRSKLEAHLNRETENKAKWEEMHGKQDTSPSDHLVYLLSFDHWMPPDELVSEMKMLGFRPGNFHQLVALAESGHLPVGSKVEALGTDLTRGDMKCFPYAIRWTKHADWGAGFAESEHLIPPLFLAVPL